jgi:hypothetical protein
VAKECLELARFRGDPNILDIAESAAERVPTQCLVKAVAVGLQIRLRYAVRALVTTLFVGGYKGSRERPSV